MGPFPSEQLRALDPKHVDRSLQSRCVYDRQTDLLGRLSIPIALLADYCYSKGREQGEIGTSCVERDYNARSSEPETATIHAQRQPGTTLNVAT
jgi:hypothetical protein